MSYRRSVALAALALGLAQPPSLPAEGWGFAIRLDNHVTTAAAGDTLAYQVTLSNTGAAPAAAEVELTLPVGAAVVSVHDGGQAPEPWFAKWAITVPAGGSVTVSAAFRAGEPAPDADGYAASACLVRNYARLICATDIDQVPGGPGIEATGTANDPARVVRPPVLIATLLLLAVVIALWRRRYSTRAIRNADC